MKKYNIVIVHCHTANRGDEAAVHAMVDELRSIFPQSNISLMLRGSTRYPNIPKDIDVYKQFTPIGKKKFIDYILLRITGGKLAFTQSAKTFRDVVKKADIIVHAPGGPSIGDTYYEGESQYLRIYDILIAMNKRYMFYAPSMGPFNICKRNAWRRKVLSKAEAIVLRDPISAEYVTELLPSKKIYQTIDSALQHDINIVENEKKLIEYSQLKQFLDCHEKNIGVTITDLLWHPVWGEKLEIKNRIINSFREFLMDCKNNKYGIVFIPQLYGTENDYDLMSEFCYGKEDFFILTDKDERYDTYFQQYLIGQLYAVVGMRYHSNIFSAKMGTPFISVSYEQKMQGFMKKMGLDDYCIKLDNLTSDELKEYFTRLETNYDVLKEKLEKEHNNMKNESFKTSQILRDLLVREQQ